MKEVTPKDCYGCFACYSKCPSQAITMVSENGFYQPVINQKKCVNCGLCRSVCPAEHEAPSNTYRQAHLMAYNKNDDLRFRESSGGVFSAFSEEIFKHGGVVYGAAYNSDFIVEHIRLEKRDDLSKLFGSKYSQSSVGDCVASVKKDLVAGRFVLFSGTPCQVFGLKLFLGSDFPNLFTIDFLCHGVPSALLLAKYLLLFDKEEITGINMRSKENQKGWSKFSFKIDMGTHSHVKTNRKEPYMIAFAGDICLNETCYSCPFRNTHCSDITLGDFWGKTDLLSSKDKVYGVSRVLINTKKGEELLGQSSNSLILRDIPTPFVYQYVIRSQRHKMKKKFLLLLERKGFKTALNRILPFLYWDKLMHRLKK